MVGAGFGVWIVWSGELTEAVPHTFQDYGGMPLVVEENQAFWFFFTKDAFQALARLQVWARLNALPVFVQIMPAKLLIGLRLERSLSIATDLYSQEAMEPKEFEILVHPKAGEEIKGVPGITLQPVDQTMGMAAVSWSLLQADPRLGSASSLGWYFILKPLGNPLDKAFIEGWRIFFAHLERILDRLKLKYILHENFLIFGLDNYNALKTWCREILSMIRDLRENEEGGYWPSVMAAVEKAGLNFNEELPNKVSIDWNQMAPDFPHMSYRTAFLLGDRFHIKDVRSSLERSRITDWCYVHLAEGDQEEEEGGTLQVSYPAALLAGKEPPCFYCGLRNHAVSECPSRRLTDLNPKIWDSLAKIGIEEMNSGFLALGGAVEQGPLQALESGLAGKDTAAILTKAVYEDNFSLQLRMLPLVWRSIGKELPQGLGALAPVEENKLTRALETFSSGDLAEADRMAREEVLHAPGDYRVYLLQGFIAMEKGETEKALSFWKEAEPLCKTPLQNGYAVFLQARLMEIQFKFDAATMLYKQASILCHRWMEPVYRQAVCMVKMGFTEHALSPLDGVIEKNPHMFNRVLIDPELERGYVQILSHLWGTWTDAYEKAEQSRVNLEELSREIVDWLGEGHDFTQSARKQISGYLKFANIENFVAFRRLIQGYARSARALKAKVDAEAKVMKQKVVDFRERLKVITKEISWFPFPRALRDFNKDFNFCAEKLNWAAAQHFRVAKNFKKASDFFLEVEKKLDRLDSRLVTLRIVRDATLFMLILGKSFMWLEIVGLGLALLLVPGVVYFADSIGFAWAKEVVIQQKWALSKGLVVILSLAALIIAALRTSFSFEKKKEKFFEKKGVG
ncbi:MAG: tetratricopeptide repeat protein [Thermodesulfobacteriota bacterium]|nr:tetratricopeptide repeat protein [Thermodesulfobacteriota bacterium]